MKKFMKKLVKKAEGFTLVELVVVIAILGILAGIAIPAYSGYLEKANKANDDAQIALINTAISATCALHGANVSDSDVSVTMNNNAVSAFTIGSGANNSVLTDYTTLYTGNTVDLEYYSSLSITGNVVSGVPAA